MSTNKLTDKQRMFVKEYLIDLNATQAAIRAGYSQKTANEQGARMLANVSIQEEIQKEMNKRANRIEITADKVLQEIAKLAFVNVKDLYDEKGNLKDITDLDDNITSAISSIKVQQKAGDMKISLNSNEAPIQHIDEQVKEIKLWDKKASLELLGKHLKLFTDVSETKIDGKLEISMSNDIKELSK